MTIEFFTYSNKISNERLKQAHDQLYSRSQTYRDTIDGINNSGENVRVMIVDRPYRDGNTHFGSATDTDNVRANSSTILISQDRLTGTNILPI